MLFKHVSAVSLSYRFLIPHLPLYMGIRWAQSSGSRLAVYWFLQNTNSVNEGVTFGIILCYWFLTSAWWLYFAGQISSLNLHIKLTVGISLNLKLLMETATAAVVYRYEPKLSGWSAIPIKKNPKHNAQFKKKQREETSPNINIVKPRTSYLRFTTVLFFFFYKKSVMWHQGWRFLTSCLQHSRGLRLEFTERFKLDPEAQLEKKKKLNTQM